MERPLTGRGDPAREFLLPARSSGEPAAASVPSLARGGSSRRPAGLAAGVDLLQRPGHLPGEWFGHTQLPGPKRLPKMHGAYADYAVILIEQRNRDDGPEACRRRGGAMLFE